MSDCRLLNRPEKERAATTTNQCVFSWEPTQVLMGDVASDSPSSSGTTAWRHARTSWTTTRDESEKRNRQESLEFYSCREDRMRGVLLCVRGILISPRTATAESSSTSNSHIELPGIISWIRMWQHAMCYGTVPDLHDDAVCLSASGSMMS